MEGTPPITLTISTTRGWEAIAPVVGAARTAAEAARGELIVADASGLPAPGPDVVGPATTWISAPGEDVFQLRERAYRAAKGRLIAITEDHCYVPADWATSLIRSHAERPDAAAIGGSIVNGATGTAMDWASFLIVQAPAAAPIRSGDSNRIAGAVNTAYKREALESVAGERTSRDPEIGALDVAMQAAIRRAGGRLVADDRIRVVHDQSLGFGGTVAIHYHAGRAFAGYRRRHFDAEEVVRFVGALVVPLARFARTMALVLPRGYVRPALAAAPAILLLLYAQAAGHIVGYILGPGDSAQHVQ